MRFTRTVGVLAVTVGLLLSASVPASAAIQGGFKTCSVNARVKVSATTQGNTAVNVDDWRTSYYVATVSARDTLSPRQSGTWGVSAPVLLSAFGSSEPTGVAAPLAGIA